jgi:phosphatidylinositol alpha-1,6-mannosyltransferase
MKFGHLPQSLGGPGHLSCILVSDIFPPKTGGSGRWFWEIYRRLPREDFLIAAGEDPRQADFDRSHDLRVQRLPLAMAAWGLRSIAGLRGYWRCVRRLRAVAREHRVAMVHAARCLPEGFMAWLLKRCCGIPYACYVHGEDVNSASTSRELRWMVRRVFGAADFVIPNSRNTLAILKDEWHLPDERIRLLHPGVDTDRFVPAPRSLAVRDRLGWTDRTVVLTVGRLQKRKGHDQMIRALARIRQAIPDILYAIMGDGEERTFLRELVRREGLEDQVQFLGELNDEALVHCYQQCDLFALPNRTVGRDIEGFGMVLLEAQACGKAVLAGASGGTAETMWIPETGRVVNCDGPQDLASLVIELLGDHDRLTRMGQAARQWVVERFDWAALSHQAELLFQVGPKASIAFSAEPVHS